jgi:hypothetical protein
MYCLISEHQKTFNEDLYDIDNPFYPFAKNTSKFLGLYLMPGEGDTQAVWKLYYVTLYYG